MLIINICILLQDKLLLLLLLFYYSKWTHLFCQAVIPTGWSLGSSTGAGVRWASYVASLSCPRCAARSAPLRGLACSSELLRDTSPSMLLLCRDRWDNSHWFLWILQESVRFQVKTSSQHLFCAPCVFPDPGTASPAGSVAVMGQDGILSRHEVPGGEVVQLLGKPSKHLLLRPAAPQRYVDESYTG